MAPLGPVTWRHNQWKKGSQGLPMPDLHRAVPWPLSTLRVPGSRQAHRTHPPSHPLPTAPRDGRDCPLDRSEN